MCSRQEDFHRLAARELVSHLAQRGAVVRLGDIAEPGPACSAATAAEAVTVSLQLEQWILQTFSVAQQIATTVSDSSLLNTEQGAATTL